MAWLRAVFCGYGGLPAALPLHPDKHIEQGFFVTGGVSVLQVRWPKVSMKAIASWLCQLTRRPCPTWTLLDTPWTLLNTSMGA
jgi:hypothetical protein